MQVEWWFSEDIDLSGSRELLGEDGARQRHTAEEILRRFADQPGVILADEVGMGKTYVALAVAASVLLQPGRHDPVVIMVPPGLVEKWQNEWENFKRVCGRRPRNKLDTIECVRALTTREFFGVLHNHHPRRIVIVKTNTFSDVALRDGWMKLALLRLAKTRTRLSEGEWQRIYKWAPELVRLGSQRGLTEQVVEDLMRLDADRWGAFLVGRNLVDADHSDPVPKHLFQHADRIDWTPLTTTMGDGTIPGRSGNVSDERLREARQKLTKAINYIYAQWRATVPWKASLLILDEAHHAKNADTKLARLFHRTTDEGDQQQNKPALTDKFERMLLLTATPFQLGHAELTNLLRIFAAARWSGARAPARSSKEFLEDIEMLEERLSENRLAGRHLDHLWGQLRAEAIPHSDASLLTDEDVLRWWQDAAGREEEPTSRELRRAYDACIDTRARAETDRAHPWRALRTWLIRHNRPTMLMKDDGASIDRRARRDGASIQTEGVSTGLTIAGSASLPFLLSARAQGEMAAMEDRGRAYFAEGLCSSYEAFFETRGDGGLRDGREEHEDRVGTGGADGDSADDIERIVPLEWYIGEIDEAARKSKSTGHPKVDPVVRKVVSLWESGEKVLVFAFYRKTVQALDARIEKAVRARIREIARDKLDQPAATDDEMDQLLERIAERLRSPQHPLSRAIERVVLERLRASGDAQLEPLRDRLVGLLKSYSRTPGFVVRYLPLSDPDVRRSLIGRSQRGESLEARVALFEQALQARTDLSGQTFAGRVDTFLESVRDLADRAISVDDEESADADEATEPVERGKSRLEVYLDSVTVTNPDHGDDARTVRLTGTRVVRAAHGEVPAATRARLVQAFNSPLYPDVVISSAVLGEGIDLHRFCRHVIHHDLAWNPSTLEQRTGRVDRIRCKAEVTRHAIEVFEPFIAGSADEKMFRVVRDRERWFQVVMGEGFALDEASTERLAARVPLPEALTRELVFDLRVYGRAAGKDQRS